MWGKLMAIGVVGFWLAMMTSLVRTEWLGNLGGGDVPSKLVLQKVFSQEAPARLNVFSDGRLIGFCKVDIDPEYRTADDDSHMAADRASREPSAYRVHSELILSLGMFGTPTRLRIVGNSLFNSTFDIEEFRINALLGEGRVNVRGDSASQKVRVDYSLGEFTDHREMDFAQLRGAGLANAIGLPGLANFSFLGAGGLPTAYRPSGAATEASQSMTTVRMSHMDIAGEKEEAYLVESRLDETMWAKIWVSKQGEVLKVETSFHLDMKADTLTDIESRYPDIPDATY